MHFYKRLCDGAKKCAFGIISLIPYLFLVLIIFSFGEAYVAILTVLSAALHELGHVIAMAMIGRTFSISGVLSGMRLKPKRLLSYGEEILVAAAGPVINTVLFFAFIFAKNAYFTAFALINLFTALSNLLPIPGYDGYRIASAIIAKYGDKRSARAIFSALSFFSIALLTFLSLYCISRLNSGYWTFFVFMLFLIREIKNDRRVFFARKKEISGVFKRF